MFKQGDKVIVKHQREMGECIVVDPHEETDMEILVNEVNGQKIHKPVGYYVRIRTPNAKHAGYHPWNLEKV